MKRIILLLAVLCSVPALAQTAAIQGFCDLGGAQAKTSGLNSTNYQQGIIPSCTITVYLTGTTTKATIYADGNNTPLSNPFTASALGSVAPGQWIFWTAVNQGYDVVASGGIAPNTYPAPVTLCADCFPSFSFSPMAGVSSINGAAGSFIFDGGAVSCAANDCTFSQTALQTNGTPNASQSLLNFTNSTDCTWTNPSGGEEQVDCGINGALQMFVPDPLGTQSVVVPFTVATNFNDGAGDPACSETSNPTSGQVRINGGSNLGCQSSPGPTITWSAAQLPAYISPANVTAVYAVGTVGYTGTSQSLNLVCTVPSVSSATLMNGGTVSGSPDSAVQKPYSAQLTGATGANFGTISCVANVAANSGGATNPAILNVPSIVLRVYYTGTAPPASTTLNVTSPLYINTALNALGSAAVNLAYNGDGGVVGLLPAANLAPPTQTTLNGTTAGTAVWSQPQQFTTWKTAAVYLNGYENTTATAQTITLPASFATVGYVVTDGGASCTPGGSGSLTISGSTVTLPASMSAPQTGLCEIRGW